MPAFNIRGQPVRGRSLSSAISWWRVMTPRTAQRDHPSYLDILFYLLRYEIGYNYQSSW